MRGNGYWHQKYAGHYVSDDIDGQQWCDRCWQKHEHGPPESWESIIWNAVEVTWTHSSTPHILVAEIRLKCYCFQTKLICQATHNAIPAIMWSISHMGEHQSYIGPLQRQERSSNQTSDVIDASANMTQKQSHFSASVMRSMLQRERNWVIYCDLVKHSSG